MLKEVLLQETINMFRTHPVRTSAAIVTAGGLVYGGYYSKVRFDTDEAVCKKLAIKVALNDEKLRSQRESMALQKDHKNDNVIA